jgi:ATP-binding cassette, subfamily B, bacterial
MKFIAQHDQMDCGPSCLAMVSSFYGKNYSLEYLRGLSHYSREGVSLLGLSEAAEKIGFETFPTKISVEKLINLNDQFPCILYWNQEHFVVLYKVKKSIFSKINKFVIADPSHGIISLYQESFNKAWGAEDGDGVVLLLKPTSKFYELYPKQENKLSLKFVLKYLTPYRKQLLSIFSLLLLGSCLTFIFPFLSQYLIDKGVNGKNLHVITIILIAQLALFIGSVVIDVFRNWLMLYIGNKISITIISDFLKKILYLPIKFFDTKSIGDFNQRIQDNERIEHFLTSQSLITFFSIITFSVFFGILWYYDFIILLVYLTLTILSILWSFYWLKRRMYLDYFKFQYRSENQESVYEILNGVSEMKLNQFEHLKLKEWDSIQQKLFKINIRILKIDQIQQSGFEFLNQVKNILVTFLAASYVVKGLMTLGELLSVSYIVGQMNSPVNQLVLFFRSLQDAKLSLERLNEVQKIPMEENDDMKKIFDEKSFHNPVIDKGIEFKNACFQYDGTANSYILKNINLIIPDGKITAIVGSSGSGKTTLIKLLLKYYEPTEGQILYNSYPIDEISARNLRENCGTVMQDGYIFSDTIERNIATGDEFIDVKRLKDAVKIANIGDFIENLPLKFKTKIGASGNGISGGQKQRILIARAVYKNPKYIYFDEATSALDAENEKVIHNNLQEFFKQKTVVIVAHRLSTVKNADQIVVLKDGNIVEIGSHNELVNNKKDYFNLIKNQLELGN